VLTELPEFQSLLFWISGSEWLIDTADGAAADGFNPCCSGSAVVSDIVGGKPAGPDMMFQSLLFWISGSEEARMRER